MPFRGLWYGRVGNFLGGFKVLITQLSRRTRDGAHSIILPPKKIVIDIK